MKITVKHVQGDMRKKCREIGLDYTGYYNGRFYAQRKIRGEYPNYEMYEEYDVTSLTVSKLQESK